MTNKEVFTYLFKKTIKERSLVFFALADMTAFKN